MFFRTPHSSDTHEVPPIQAITDPTPIVVDPKYPPLFADHSQTIELTEQLRLAREERDRWRLRHAEAMADLAACKAQRALEISRGQA